MRPELLVPAHKLHPAGNLSFEQLALVETLAIGCHAVSRSSLTSDDTCLIIGAGPIGLATLEFVKLTGAKFAIADISQSRLDFCRRQMQVEHVLSPFAPRKDELESEKTFESQLREIFDGHLPDVVIDATGNPQSMSDALGLIAPGGRLVYVGLTGEEIHFRHSNFHRPEGALLCSRNALPADFTHIISLIQSGQIDTRPWITHRCSLPELLVTMPTYLNPESGVVKAIAAID
jgi:alcohol dehydrogenase